MILQLQTMTSQNIIEAHVLNESEFLLYLDNYYIRNIYYEIFIIIFYTFFSIGIFFIYRYNNLGLSINVDLFFGLDYNRDSLLTLLMFTLNIMYYLSILSRLFYIHVIKIHFYLYQYEWYRDLCSKVKDNFLSFADKVLRIELYFYWSICDKKVLMKSLQSDKSIEERVNKMLNRKENDLINIYETARYKRWEYINNRKILYFCYKSIHYFLDKLPNISYLLSYWIYIITFLVLIYDIFNGTLYYIYYMLLVLLISNFIKKIRRFIYVTDPVCDDVISKYFYSKNMDYYIKRLENATSREKYLKKRQDDETEALLWVQEELESYIKNDFTVDYAIRDALDEQYTYNGAKRLNIILVIILGIIYYIVSDKYVIQISEITINIGFLFMPFIILLYLLHKKIRYVNKEIKIPKETKISTSMFSLPSSSEDLRYKWSFIILSALIIILMLYIMLKNKLTMEPNEIILNLKDYIIITEIFSINEKMQYLDHYIKYLKKISDFEQEHWEYLLNEIQSKLKIDTTISLKDIRDKIKLIFSS